MRVKKDKKILTIKVKYTRIGSYLSNNKTMTLSAVELEALRTRHAPEIPIETWSRKVTFKNKKDIPNDSIACVVRPSKDKIFSRRLKGYLHWEFAGVTVRPTVNAGITHHSLSDITQAFKDGDLVRFKSWVRVHYSPCRETKAFINSQSKEGKYVIASPGDIAFLTGKAVRLGGRYSVIQIMIGDMIGWTTMNALETLDSSSANP